MINVGTSTRRRSFRKSVDENAVTQSRVPLAEAPGDLAASHREADEGEVMQVERSHQLVEVFSEGVVVVAARRLAGVAEPSAVVRDDSVARTQEVRDLLLP